MIFNCKSFAMCGLLCLASPILNLQASRLSDLISQIQNDDPNVTQVVLLPTGSCNKAFNVLLGALKDNTHVKSLLIRVFSQKENAIPFDDASLQADQKTPVNQLQSGISIDEQIVSNFSQCLAQNTTLQEMIINDIQFFPSSLIKSDFFKAIGASKYLKRVRFDHCFVEFEDFIEILKSPSIEMLSVTHSPNFINVNLEDYFQKNPMPKNSSLKALNVCGTYIDQEWPRGLAYQDSFMQKCSEFSEQYVIQPFMKLLQSIPSFEKLVISKEYTFDGIITPTTIYFKNTPNVLQNTGSQKNTTNSSNWNVNLNDNLKLNKNEKPLILNENLNVNCLNNTNYLNINTINLWNKNKYSGSSSSSSSNSSERPLKFEDMGVTQLTKEQRKSLHKSQKLAEKEMTKKAKAKMKGKKKIDESSESEDSSDDDGNKDNK